MKLSYLLMVVLFGCVWTHVAAEGEGERTHFLEAFPDADPKNFGNLAVESLAYEPEKVEEPRPFAFACPIIPLPANTTSVNQLKPGHIKVVMSMGDSITAGMSARDTNVLNLHEYRGISYAIGGDPGVITFPNLLRHYTEPDYPVGISVGIGKRTIASNGLNAALSGAINSGMHEQAVWLVEQLKVHKYVDITHDWKILTIWIGSNNLCQVCNDELANNAEDFENNIMKALEYIRKNVPKVFVNLVSNMDITKMYDVKAGTCQAMHAVECPCPSSQSAKTRTFVQNVIAQYWATARNISANYGAQRYPDFAVVVQPFLQNSPIYDRTYLSSADCFHPSGKAHEAMSISLWNNIISRAANKATSWNIDDVPLCATADTLLYTN